jgi:hypothetical protein
MRLDVGFNAARARRRIWLTAACCTAFRDESTGTRMRLRNRAALIMVARRDRSVGAELQTW